MEQIIVEITLLRFGAKRFENRVNALVKEGYKIKEITWEHYFLRTFLYARLEK